MNPEVAKGFGQRLKEMRMQRGLSQLEFSMQIDIAQSHYGMIELGRKDVSLSTLYKIASALGISMGDLVGGEVSEGTIYDDPEMNRVIAYMSVMSPEVRKDIADIVRIVKESHEH